MPAKRLIHLAIEIEPSSIVEFFYRILINIYSPLLISLLLHVLLAEDLSGTTCNSQCFDLLCVSIHKN